MTGRATTWLAVALWLVCVSGLMTIFAVETARSGWPWLVRSLGWSLIFVTPTVGALVAAHRPRNPIGWLICAFCVALTGTLLAPALYPPGTSSVPGAFRWFVLVTEALAPVTFLTMITLLLLLFPTGKLTSPRWRPVAWLAVALIAGLSVGRMVGADQLWTDPVVYNPAHISAAETVLRPLGPVALILIPAVVLASMLSLVMRFRRSRGVERRQLEWFTYAVGLEVAAILASIILSELPWGEELGYDVFGFIAIYIGMPIGLPVVIGIAILRHDLFDIERLINRTLVYLFLTISLASCYVVLIVGFGSVLRALSGSSSSLGIAASTLAIAALFRPARRRIQDVVDRHFYRHKYDATRTIEQFSSQMREIVELPALESALVATATASMQPAHASLWLRPPVPRSPAA